MTHRRRRLTGSGNSPDTTPPTVPVRKPTFLNSRETPTLRATWLGHACYFVEFPGGLRVLFDPVFEARCSPFTWLGPKRYTEVPCQIEDIPTIDVVVISHSHYDHLSRTLLLLSRLASVDISFRSDRETNTGPSSQCPVLCATAPQEVLHGKRHRERDGVRLVGRT